MNFICGAGWELDPNKLYGLDPNVFCVKITPLNITTATKEHGLEDAIQWNWENMNKIKEKVESCGLKVIVDVAAKAELPLCCGNLVQDYKKTKQENNRPSFTVVFFVLANIPRCKNKYVK